MRPARASWGLLGDDWLAGMNESAGALRRRADYAIHRDLPSGAGSPSVAPLFALSPIGHV
jgi:hypothetical protein